MWRWRCRGVCGGDGVATEVYGWLWRCRGAYVGVGVPMEV